MAHIQQIDRRSVHHLQSGQVINEGLTSAVKELVENSLDAHATSIEVRFKSYGLESIEVIDNGDGVPPDSYETIALKHYTSKLKDYADLDNISTFGFRGEALSSLCALSDLTITTARDCDAPKGVKLVFESSGKLKSQSVVAASKGTTVCSANLFKTLPVRRKEMERNIKREYTKVLGILQAYASICVGVKFSVFNQPPKGKKTPAFATKGNPTTRENISNIFGSKSLAALLPLDLEFQLTPTLKGTLAKMPGRRKESRTVKVVGHISRPVVGEGRNAPDRQMFFVNGRPCNLPQFAKAINEVYKGFNVTQSPFIFADIQLDTDAYDVNVSPDKRTILLHDQADLLENLKSSLLELFEQHEQTVPVNQIQPTQQKLPSYKQFSLPSLSSSPARASMGPSEQDGTPERTSVVEINDGEDEDEQPEESSDAPSSLISSFALNAADRRKPAERAPPRIPSLPFKPPSRTRSFSADKYDSPEPEAPPAEAGAGSPEPDELPIPSSQIPQSERPPVQRSPRRTNAPATITIGNRSPVISGSPPKVHFSPPSKRRRVDSGQETISRPKRFANALNKFRAPGTQLIADTEESMDDEGTGDEEEDVGDRGERMDGSFEEVGDDHVRETYPWPTDTTELDERPLFHHPTIDDSDDEDDQMPQPPSKPSEAIPLGDAEEEEEPGPSPDINDESPQPTTLDDDEGEYIPPSQAAETAKARAARRLAEAEASESQSATLPSEEILHRAARLLRGNPETCTYNLVRSATVSLDFIRSQAAAISRATSISSPFSGSSSQPSTIPAATALCSQPNAADDETSLAEKKLTLTITKQDFLRMSIKGQFNLGFILATRGRDLFIIDQHASDEKYNFETLQLTTVVQSQPLVRPRTLELMAMDEVMVIEHLETFRRNGFVINVDEEEIVGRRCRLLSLPMSKETVFDVKDLEEIVHLIHTNPAGAREGLRPAKVRSMFAMRACRKSVMVGKALNLRQMERIVRNMAEMEKPWNCPHGRPTMRHLCDLEDVGGWREYATGDEEEEVGGRRLDWEGENWEVSKEMAFRDSDEEEEAEEGEGEAEESAMEVDE